MSVVQVHTAVTSMLYVLILLVDLHVHAQLAIQALDRTNNVQVSDRNVCWRKQECHSAFDRVSICRFWSSVSSWGNWRFAGLSQLPGVVPVPWNASLISFRARSASLPDGLLRTPSPSSRYSPHCYRKTCRLPMSSTWHWTLELAITTPMYRLV